MLSSDGDQSQSETAELREHKQKTPGQVEISGSRNQATNIKVQEMFFLIRSTSRMIIQNISSSPTCPVSFRVNLYSPRQLEC